MTMTCLTQARSATWSAMRRGGVVIGLTLLGVSVAGAQWSTTYEQFYLQAPHNWEFRNRYQSADRLFNAFDFGHAILYETLWSKPGAPASELEQKWYDRLTKQILVRPPHVPLEEGAIEIAYARLAPEAKAMFDWAHILHRQVYDVWADESIPADRKDAEVARLLAYYKTRRDLAFSSKPKSMELMQEQSYSLAFRKQYPKFNGLIWAYHWLQVGLYEPLLLGKSSEERQAGVRATVARFWQMLENPTSTMPYQMPMTAAVAPEFSKRYPEAGIIFDNLHSMHDVVSDILANDSVPRNRKRAELMRAVRLFRDDTSYVMTEQAWRTMAQHMGVENMGGPVAGFLTEPPPPTVTYGAVMTHDQRTGEMTGFKYGQATGGAHARMGAQSPARPADSTRATATDHSRMAMPPRDSAGRRADSSAVQHQGHETPDSARRAEPGTGAPDVHMQRMMELHMRMMADPVIRQRIMADSAMRRIMQEIMRETPAEHRERMESMMKEPAPREDPTRRPATPTRRTPGARGPVSRPPAATRPAERPAARPADPHAGHQMPAPKAAPKPPPTAAPTKPAAKKDSVQGMNHSKVPGKTDSHPDIRRP